jgi:hypothetical protein
MRTTWLVVCTLALGFCTSAWAGTTATTPTADTLKVDYFSNANTGGAPDATVRLDNPGTSGGNICAAIYVFDAAQEMSECCSCLLTPDGLRTLSVNGDLTSNPLTGVTLNTGVIKLVSTVDNGACPAYPYSITPTPALRGWVTHIENNTFALTETNAADATLSSNEVNRLQAQCKAIWLDGSGKGKCSCGTGD